MIFDLPKKCYVNKFLPKKLFYEKLVISSKIKDDFINSIERITWLYKLSQDTVGISKTDTVEEIEIFQIDLKEKVIPLGAIKTITKGIPYKILFVLKYKEEQCLAITVEEIYYTDWGENIYLEFNYLNLELIYENFVKRIIGENNTNRTFDEIIESKVIIDKLKERIRILRNKIKREKQFNKKVELNNELNELLKELEEINNE